MCLIIKKNYSKKLNTNAHLKFKWMAYTKMSMLVNERSQKNVLLSILKTHFNEA